MNTALLQVKDLSIDFPAGDSFTRAVNKISFEVQPGKVVALVGESGSGKSVSALSLLGLLPAGAKVAGEILFTRKDGSTVNLLQLPEKLTRQLRGKEIAMIFQEPMTSLNPVFTCGSQVAEAIQLHQRTSKKAAREKAIALFDRVQLPDPPKIFDRFPHQLSGGQKQRVMIAMAMSCDPALLIADEPTTALDVTVQKNILELVKELQVQQGMSVLLITHDLGVVADYADTVLVMYKGNIIEAGDTAELLAAPRHPYTKALLHCRPALHAKGDRLPVVGEQLRVDAGSIDGAAANVVPVTTTSGPVLEVDKLVVDYPGKKSFWGKSTGTFRAVDGISFTVSKGETLGLVGESGCGKTTLGRALLQLVPARSGKVILNGTDLLQLPAGRITPLRKDMQVVFQDPYGSLNPRITIGDAIAEPMQVHGLFNNSRQRKEKVMELLGKVSLDAAHYNRFPHQFSGGQRQRICIARALALNPSLLIFDESVSALDVSVQAQVLNLLNDLKAAFSFTSIFISHDLSVVRYISDRIMVMKEGRIVETGTAEQVYHAPANAYTQQLVAAIPGKTLQKK